MVFKPVEDDIFKFDDKGDTLTGTLINIKEGIGKFKSFLYTVETPEGKTLKFWGSTTLDDQMSKVNLGDLIQVTYKGKPEGKNYDVYEVLRDVPETE